MPDDDSCDPDEGEPDIMEMVSGRPTVYQTYHWMDKFPEVKCAGTEGDGGYQHENSETVLDDKWDSEVGVAKVDCRLNFACSRGCFTSPFLTLFALRFVIAPSLITVPRVLH